MGIGNRLSRDEVLATAAAMPRHLNKDGSYYYKGIATELGINASSAKSRIRSIQSGRYDAIIHEAEPHPDYEPPVLIDPEAPVEDLIARLKTNFERRHAAEQSREWMRFRIKADGPYGLAFMGDPHMDDPGCNWPLLERDVRIVTDTPSLFSVPLGDYTNNWAGRLQRLYSGQDVTKQQAWKLAEWFFGRKKPSGQSTHLLLLKGNHDAWSGDTDPLDWMARGSAVLTDWSANFIVTASNGQETAISAAHDFKGSSIWNPLHGPMRKGKLDGRAAVYVCGDKHNWACMQVESEDKPGEVYWAARARGYKYIDSYAKHGGYGQQQYGATVAAIIDPTKTGPAAVTCFPDLEEAAGFLTFKRRKA